VCSALASPRHPEQVAAGSKCSSLKTTTVSSFILDTFNVTLCGSVTVGFTIAERVRELPRRSEQSDYLES
jgi:hypothetical protein